MKFNYEKFGVPGIKSPKPSLQKGALVNRSYLNYWAIIRNGFTLKFLFRGRREKMVCITYLI